MLPLPDNAVNALKLMRAKSAIGMDKGPLSNVSTVPALFVNVLPVASAPALWNAKVVAAFFEFAETTTIKRFSRPANESGQLTTDSVALILSVPLHPTKLSAFDEPELRHVNNILEVVNVLSMKPEI